MSFRFSRERANLATIQASNRHTLKTAKMHRRLFVALLLCVAVGLSAEQPAANFQSREFRSALAAVLHARLDDFAELKTSGAVFQLPNMSCSLAPHGKTATYLCSAPASPGPEAESLYNSLTATLTAALPGYPLCRKPATANDIRVTSFCHYPTIFITDASVRIEKSVVSLEVFGRDAGDRGEPALFLHAYSLAELGRHADAIKALEPILGPGIDRHIYEQERLTYDAALKATLDCAAEQICMASDFFAIGNIKEAALLQHQVFKGIEAEAEANRKRGYKLDPISARTAGLADDYDLQARILAAEGKLNSALLELDSTYGAVPLNAKGTALKAAYAYHRALILAEGKQYAKAAKACRESLGIDATANLQEQLDQPQCIEIGFLASHQPVPEENNEPAEADAAADSVHDASIQAEIDEAAGTNNCSALPPLTESQGAPEQDRNLTEWVVENGTQYMLHVLMSGPSDQRIDVAPGNSTLIALPPGKYRVAAVLDRRGTLLYYGEQTLQPGLKYTSNFVVSPN
jgi:tetratricopeptide (TPR) repeat protein